MTSIIVSSREKAIALSKDKIKEKIDDKNDKIVDKIHNFRDKLLCMLSTLWLFYGYTFSITTVHENVVVVQESA